MNPRQQYDLSKKQCREFNPDMLTIMMDLRGYSWKELAEICAVDIADLYKIAGREIQPDYETVLALSVGLNVEVGFFYREGKRHGIDFMCQMPPWAAK